MLTADLVNARRRGKELHLVALDDDSRARARSIAARLIDATRDHVGLTRDDLVGAHGAVDVGPREHRLKDGLAKLVLDRCELEPEGTLDPEEVRAQVFQRASALRQELPPGTHLDRRAVIDEVAASRGADADAVEATLFADLRGAHVLRAFDAPTPEALVDHYERAQAQAVLLRAVRISIDVRFGAPGALRALFRRLKFLRLLYVIEKVDDRHRIVIDGPFNLFESATKYGLQLALVLPALEDCDAWSLEADIRWGKDRLPLVFHLEGGAPKATGERPPPVSDEVRALAKSFAGLGTEWSVRVNDDVLDLPGVGLCIPDLAFDRGGSARDRVYLEVMGYWSRAAVWKRVELVQAGLSARILFAVSTRLRVSEDVLEQGASAAIYVYKGTMSARAVAQRLETLPTPPRP